MTSTRSSTAPGPVALAVIGALGLCLLAASPACAAAVSADIDVLPSSKAPPAGQVLERALTGDVTSGSKNVDLLLEMRRNEAADAGRPSPALPSRPAVQVPALLAGESQPASAAQRSPDLLLAPLPTLLKRGLAETDEALGLAKGTTAQSVREWRGNGGSNAADAPVGGAPALGPVTSGAPGVASESAPPLLLPTQVIQTLRELRHWLIGAIALALVLGVAYKKFSRRI